MRREGGRSVRGHGKQDWWDTNIKNRDESGDID